MLTKRVLTALWGIPLLFSLMYFGGIWTALLVMVLTAFAAYEYCRMMENKYPDLPRTVIILVSMILTLGLSYLDYDIWLLFLFVFITGIVFWSMLKSKAWDQAAMLITGIIYISIGFGFLLSLRLGFNSFYYILLAFIISWATDSGAYFMGCSMGKRKLAPHISPNKTVAGFIGGIVFALLIAGTYAVVLLKLVSIPYIFLIIFLASVLGQIGDLFESYLKRYFGVKDSGGILPGHGGILDRFDSILTIAPLVYLLLYWVK